MWAPLHGARSVQRAWYDAYGQAMGGPVVVAEGDVVGTCGDGGGTLTVWDAM